MSKITKKLLKAYLRIKYQAKEEYSLLVSATKEHNIFWAVWFMLIDPWINHKEYSPGLILRRIGRIFGWIRVLWRDVDFEGLTLITIMLYKLKRARKVLFENWPLVGGVDNFGPDWTKDYATRLEKLDKAIDLLEKASDWDYMTSQMEVTYRDVQKELINEAFDIIKENINTWWD